MAIGMLLIGGATAAAFGASAFFQWQSNEVARRQGEAGLKMTAEQLEVEKKAMTEQLILAMVGIVLSALTIYLLYAQRRG